jgi:hypothetical protein
MEATAFDKYTEQLRTSLQTVREVIGLVVLGTTADSTFRDQWSDHDFWVITEPRTQETLLEDLSWLPDYQNIAITVRHGERRRTVVYRNRHKVEFAVFDVNEAPSGKVERYQVLLGRDQIGELINSVLEDTLSQAATRPDALENLCVLVWSACERLSRGELLSARQYVDGFAVNQLLSLISSGEVTEESKDRLDPRRRLEMTAPALATEVLQILGQQVPEAALHLLQIVERELKLKAPTLAWDKVAMVRGWIYDLVNNVPAS